ncbi:cytochrome c oxidase subunit 3 [Gangjinia marincola]|uniref:Cytochrome c oxidase subunit 3 n=1 Tax=Gangjinia marincola TaxID=578463 RepID=A0ABP3XQF3_9FLAO
MDLTQGTQYEKHARSRKMMLWFGIISMVMTFAGLTSAYIVSSNRPDWISDFNLPMPFIYSTVAVVLSSITIIAARFFLKKNDRSKTTLFLGLTVVLGLVFVFFQLEGFQNFISSGYYVTGAESTITTSFIYVIVLLHLLHLSAGIIVLLVVMTNQLRGKYTPQQMLGFELGEIFWHFVDILWVLLLFFFAFVK